MISSSRPPRSYPQDFIEALRSWANSPKAEDDLELVFGQEINWVSANQFLAGLQVGDISKLPPLKILPGESMPGLWGGYSRELRLVFLSADCPEELIIPVLLEEIGHFFDQELCAEETPGDEGAVFSAMVLGVALDHLEAADDALRGLNFEGSSHLVEAAPKVRGSAKTQGVAQPKVRGSIGSSPVPDFSTSQDGSVVYANKDSVRVVQTKGNQRLIGSKGNDTFVVASQNARIEDPKGGTDTVEASVSFSIANFRFIENLAAVSASTALSLTGNILANRITGNSGNNILDGGNDSARDTLQGGAGNDTYVLRDTLDQIIELPSNGIDTIQTTQKYFSLSIYANVENLAYIGAGVGVSLTGNSVNNTIFGSAGGDSLDGGSGADSLVGGAGNDTYRVDNIDDKVFEKASAGTDLVISTVSSYSLGNYLENLTLAGSAISGTGNSLNNWIDGNAKNNSLVGNAGNDTLEGRGVVAGGTDTLNGGLGNDVYIVDSTTDRIQDASGRDTVRSSVSFDLSNTLVAGGNAIENLTYTGSGAATLSGNNLNNSLLGNDQNNTLQGRGGVDTLSGGSGSDVYIVDTATDWIEDTSGSADEVRSLVSFDLSNALVGGGDAVENLLYTGISEAELTGNNLNNSLIGNNGVNLYLVGKDGNDYLFGGPGIDYIYGCYIYDEYMNSQIDTLTGGGGEDWFYLQNSDGWLNYNKFGIDDYALITDFEIGVDILNYEESNLWNLSDSLPSDITFGQGLYYGEELIAVIQTNTGELLNL